MSKKVNGNIVVDENGQPADYFVFSVSEKIGLPNYSSVDLFASLGRHITKDNVEEQKSVIELVEEILVSEREKVLQYIKS